MVVYALAGHALIGQENQPTNLDVMTNKYPILCLG
jgi:hypothetical protein